MRNNTKKGFTLVELLVVIAILAILATVSVVGYTSFIERADISVDEQLVAQLNNFLEAYQADHTNRFYGEKITDKNAHYIIEDIMELGGLKEIRPQSAKYGYHIFLDLNKGEFVLDKEEETIAGFSPAQKVLSAVIPGFAAEEDKTHANSMAPEYVFTKGDYFFADTHGSDIADVIRGFYEHESEFTGETLYDLHEGAEKLRAKYGSALAGIAKIMEKSAFVTDDGIIVLNVNAQHSVLFIHKGTTTIGNVKKDKDDNAAVTPENPLVVVSEGTIIIIPSTVNTILSGSLEIKHEDGTSKVTVEIDTDNINNIEYFGAGFANSDVEIQFNDGKKYNCEGTKILDSNGNAATDELTYPELVSFDITTKGIVNKANGKNVAFDVEKFSLLVVNSKIKMGGTVVDGYAPVTFEIHPDYTQYAEIEKETVKLKKAPLDGKIIILANNQEFTINVSCIEHTDMYIGVNMIEDDKGAMTLVYAAGINEYRLHADSTQFTYNHKNTLFDGVKNDNQIKVTLPENDAFAYDELSQVLTVDGNKVTAGEYNITVSLGGYTKEVTLKLRPESEYTFVRATDNITKVGNKNTVELSKLFALVGNEFPSDYRLKVEKNRNNGYYDYSTRTLAADGAITGLKNGLLALSGPTQKLQFNTEGSYTLYIVNDKGERKSEEHDITVLNNYYNVTNYSELKTNKAKNTVLLDKIVMDTNGYLELGKSAKIFGNNFVFDVTKGATSTKGGLVVLKQDCELDSIMIIGAETPNFDYPGGTNEPKIASIVYARYTSATIKNCYIANGRSPVRVGRSCKLTIENSILFGGRYANIDINKGEVVLKGDVTTINQVYEDVVGCGIVVDMAYTTSKVTLDNCNLKQYNFLGAKNSTLLPRIAISLPGILPNPVGVSLSTVFDSLFANPEYDDWKYVNAEDSFYNAGIAYLHVTKYDAEIGGQKTMNGNDGSDGDIPNGYSKTLYAEILESINGAANAHIYSPKAVKNVGQLNEYNAKLFAEKDEIFNIYNPDNFLPKE